MTNIIKLNEKQNYAYSLIANGKSVFITGAGGVGKTYIIKLFTQTYNRARTIAVTSTTGTSALLLNGTTFYSYLGIHPARSQHGFETRVERINIIGSSDHLGDELVI